MILQGARLFVEISELIKLWPIERKIDAGVQDQIVLPLAKSNEQLFEGNNLVLDGHRYVEVEPVRPFVVFDSGDLDQRLGSGLAVIQHVSEETDSDTGFLEPWQHLSGEESGVHSAQEDVRYRPGTAENLGKQRDSVVWQGEPLQLPPPPRNIAHRGPLDWLVEVESHHRITDPVFPRP